VKHPSYAVRDHRTQEGGLDQNRRDGRLVLKENPDGIAQVPAVEQAGTEPPLAVGSSEPGFVAWGRGHKGARDRDGSFGRIRHHAQCGEGLVQRGWCGILQKTCDLCRPGTQGFDDPVGESDAGRGCVRGPQPEISLSVPAGRLRAVEPSRQLDGMDVCGAERGIALDGPIEGLERLAGCGPDRAAYVVASFPQGVPRLEVVRVPTRELLGDGMNPPDG